MNDWNCGLWDLVLRVFWLTAAVVFLVTSLRLMAWADKDIKGPMTPVQKA
jgi:hypothetical protein